MLAGNDQLMSDQLGNLVVGRQTGVDRFGQHPQSQVADRKIGQGAGSLAPVCDIQYCVRRRLLLLLPDTIYDLERTSLTLWAPSV